MTSQLPLDSGAVLPPTSTFNDKRIPPKIELLTFLKFTKGTKVLGVIHEVCDEYAVVSLPTMLTGFVRQEVAEGGTGSGNGLPLTKALLPVNTIMVFYVMSTTTEQVLKRVQKKATPAAAVVKKHRIELSPLPVHVNRGVRMDEYLSSSSTMAHVSERGIASV